jgi:flagellar motor protein MotB
MRKYKITIQKSKEEKKDYNDKIYSDTEIDDYLKNIKSKILETGGRIIAQGEEAFFAVEKGEEVSFCIRKQLIK